MLVLIARNCIKTLSDLPVKKHLVLFFVGFWKGENFFFRVLDVPISNLNRLSYISLAKSVMCLFIVFSTIIFLKKLGNNRFVHRVPKKLRNVIITVFILGLIFEK